MHRYKLILEYNGTGFAGWQKQPDVPTIQHALEQAVFAFCGVECEVVGAGRTDAGVHATGQVAHVDLPREYDPYRVMQGINFHLVGTSTHPTLASNLLAMEPPRKCHVQSVRSFSRYPSLRAFLPKRVNRGALVDNSPAIAVIAAEAVTQDFHARFSATRRYYRYRIINRPARLALEIGRAWHVGENLNLSSMQQAATHLIGTHDFTSFRDSECQAKSPIKTLDTLDIQADGESIIVTADARSFLHHQVRNMVGTLVLVGKGRWQPEQVKTALSARDRKAAGPTAPADGLYLVKVSYDPIIPALA